jgi:methionyl aminopeptidase
MILLSQHSNRIQIKSADEIAIMSEGGAVLREVMDQAESFISVGLTTQELNNFIHNLLKKKNLRPAFLNKYGFPGSVCISINEGVVHGVPGQKILRNGDIVSIDCGLIKDGFYLDTARTVRVGEIDPESENLIHVALNSLRLGIDQLQPGKRLGDVSHAVQSHVESQGYSVVREYTGHGIGRELHEEPKIPNFGPAGKGVRWLEGMVVCIEPMVNAGTHETRVLDDRWTVVTADGMRSAHMEHTVAITENGPVTLT